MRASDIPRAMQLGRQGYSKSTKSKYAYGVAKSLSILGGCNYRLSNYPEAIAQTSDALTLFQTLEDKEGQAEVLNTLGNINSALGNFPSALEHYKNSLSLRQKTGILKNIASSLNNIGNTYFKMGKYKEALQYHDRSLKIKEELGDERAVGYSLNNIGNVHEKTGEIQLALQKYEASLSVFQKTKDRYGEAGALANIGSIHVSLGKIQAAIEYHLQSLKIEQELNNRFGEAESLILIGELYLLNPEFKRLPKELKEGADSAVHYFNRALEITTEIDARELSSQCHKNLSRHYQNQKDFRLALEHFQIYSDNEIKKINHDLFEKTNRLQILHEAETYKQAENFRSAESELIKKNNEELKIQSGKLIVEIEERRRAETRLVRRNQQLTAAADIARITSSTLDLDILLTTSVEVIKQRFNFYHVSIFIVEPGGLMAVLRSSTGKAGHQLKENKHKLAIGSTSLVGLATHSRKPVIVQDVTNDPTHFKNPLLPKTSAEAVIPLLKGDNLVGALDVQSEKAGVFDDWDVSILLTLADQLTIAIENARLYAAVQKELVERKIAEESLQKIKDDLEFEVRTRTTEIIKTNKELQLELQQRKRIEIELQKGQARYRDLFEGVPVGLYRSTPQGDFLDVNEVITRMFGYPSRASLLNTSALDLYINPKDRKRWQMQIEKNGVVHNFELQMRRFDGSIVWMRDTARAVRDQEKRILYYEGNLEDITERKLAESALREQEDRYRDLVENSSDLICTHDLDGNILSANITATALLGYDVESLKSKKLQDFLAPESLAGFPLYLKRIEKKGQASGIIYILTKTGEKRAWEFQNTLRVKGVEKPIVRGMAKDITDKKQAQDNLAQSLSTLQATLEATADGLLVVNNHGKIIHFNHRFIELWRIPEEIITTENDEGVINYVLDQLVDPEAFQAKVNELYKNPDLESLDTLFFKDGRIFERYSRSKQINGQYTGRVWSFRDVTDRKLAEERLAHDALHDALTGLPNRTLFLDRLGLAIKRRKRQWNDGFAVMFLDLDRFKLINDSLGHVFGDEFLISITKQLQQCLRPADTVARLGGDEFAILLEEINEPTDATRVANRIQEILSQPLTVKGHLVSTSASIGITISSPEYENAEDMIRDADTAMYRAKTSGKAHHEIFDHKMHLEVTSLLKLEADLRHALQHSEFKVFYQPQISIKTGRMIGTEALLRWNHPIRGLIPPVDFIHTLEETGMIIPVGEWVLRTACRQNKIWQENGHPDLKISVNFSTRQFQLEHLPELIKSVLEETGMDPRTLEMEITESTAILDTEMSIKLLGRIHDLGVSISLDDFGSGYSALSYLNRYPFNTLKIDRSFISKIASEISDDATLTKAIIALGQSLNLHVIAEGVETQKQVEFLQKSNCDSMQGYLFSRPVETETLTDLLKKGNFLIPD